MQGVCAVWNDALRMAVSHKSGGEAAQLLISCPLRAKMETKGFEPLPSAAIQQATQGHDLSEVAYFIAEASQAANMSDELRYCLCAFDAFQVFHTAPRSTPPVGWDTAILVTFVQRIGQLYGNIVKAAAAAGDVDSDDDAAGTTAHKLDDEVMGSIVRTWRKLFLQLKDLDADQPNAKSRRRGALAVLNGLLGILMRAGNTHQCRIIINSVEELEADAQGDPRKGVLQPCGHMGSEVVRFKYVTGRIRLYDRDYMNAFIAFREAFARLTPIQSSNEYTRRNKQRVAFYWVVAGLGLGVMPPAEVLTLDPLVKDVLGGLAVALHDGNAVRYEELIAAHRDVLCRRGVFFLLLSFKQRCLASVLRRVHAAVAASGGEPSRIELPLVQQAIDAIHGESVGETDKRQVDGPINNKQGCKDDTASSGAPFEVLSVKVAQLIANGLVRGYVAPDAATIILSKKEPFPTPTIPPLLP